MRLFPVEEKPQSKGTRQLSHTLPVVSNLPCHQEQHARWRQCSPPHRCLWTSTKADRLSWAPVSTPGKEDNQYHLEIREVNSLGTLPQLVPLLWFMCVQYMSNCQVQV